MRKILMIQMNVFLLIFDFMQEDIFGAWEFFVNHKIPARTVQDSAV